MMTTHIAGARLFPRLASMVEKSHRGFVRVVFDGMVAAITSQVDALIRDLHLVVPGRMVDVDARRGSGSGSCIRDGEEGAGEKVVERERERQRGEAEQFPEFATRLKARIAVAERVIVETRGVVEEVRGLAYGEIEEDRRKLECGHWVPIPGNV